MTKSQDVGEAAGGSEKERAARVEKLRRWVSDEGNEPACSCCESRWSDVRLLLSELDACRAERDHPSKANCQTGPGGCHADALETSNVWLAKQRDALRAQVEQLTDALHAVTLDLNVTEPTRVIVWAALDHAAKERG